MRPTTKFCPMCEQQLPAKAFAALDKNAPCKACQKETGSFNATTTTGGASAHVPAWRVLKNQRNHNRSDSRE